MARKQMKVEGKTDAEVLAILIDAEMQIETARDAIDSVAGAFAERDLQSVRLHLDKAAETVHNRGVIVEKKVTAGDNAEERKKTEKAMREAMKDPEKAAALKALLGL